jgi:alpha-galactosidase
MQIRIDETNSLRIIDSDGRTLLDNIDVRLEYRGRFHNRLSLAASGAWTLSARGGVTVARCGNAGLECRREGAGLLVRTTFTNTTGARLGAMTRLMVLGGCWRETIDRCLYNEFSSFNGNVCNEMESTVQTARLVPDQTVTGADNVAFVDAAGTQVLFGFATYERYYPAIGVSHEGVLEAFLDMESHPLEPGESLVGDWLYLGTCADIPKGLCEFADLVARQMQVQLKPWEMPTGHCSWYYYLDRISEQTVAGNLAALSADRDKLPIRYIQIDNGWSTEPGDWEANARFPRGMKAVADDIRAQGYLPGIWLMPFTAARTSRLFQAHPDWFVKNWKNDEIYGTPSLDFSVPAVREHIFNLFRRLSHEWGFRYIKLDAVIVNLAPGRHRDQHWTAVMNLREGYRVMRSAVTEDTFILGCTSPLAQSAGVVDGMRVSCDIFDRWEAVKDVFMRVFKRFYYHKRLFINDPDCLIIRTSANEDEECRRPCVRNAEEIRTFVTAMAASGGILMLSDKMSLLDRSQIELLSKLFPVNTEAAVPLDLMESNVPGVLDLGRRGRTRIMALINWTDVDRELRFEINRGHVFDFWSQRYLGLCDHRIRRTLAPHASALLFVTDDAPAAVVGVDDCLCPAVEQEYRDGVLTASFVKPGEKAMVAAAREIQSCEGGRARPVETAFGRLYEVTAVRGARTFRITFKPE